MGHRIGLDRQNAIYPYSRGKVVTYAIAPGVTSFTKDLLFGNMRMPKFVIIGLQPSKAFDGTYALPVEDYDMADIASITLTKGSDFRDTYNLVDGYMPAYTKSIIRNMNHLEKNTNIGIDFTTWVMTKCLFTFNLAPDFDPHACQIAKDGNLQLEIRFTNGSMDALIVVVYGVFDTEVQITKAGEVIR
jgi:hypothetical protein